MEENSFDVIVVGAGAAGLMAAWELVQTGKRTAVVEARNRVGGRMHTINDPDFELPVELGAEFVHGDLPLTKMLSKKAGLKQYKVSGEIWQNEDGGLDEQNDFVEDYSALNKKFKELKKDISVADFIENYLQGKEFEETRFTLKNYVEGYYAADTTRASTFSLKEELNSSDEDQFRIEGGYIKLVSYLHEQCKEKGASFFLSHPVKEIKWKRNEVEVITDKKTFTTSKVMITVPVGVLQSETIRFSPALPQIIAAAKQLGFGPVIKTVLQFDEVLWKNKSFTQGRDLDKLSFIFSKAIIPTWWTCYPKDAAMITGWSGGPHADELKDLSNDEIFQKAIQSLSRIFSVDAAILQKKLKAWHVTNWVNDAYTRGGYSYEVVNGTALKEIIRKPVEDTIFFTGEGLYNGTEIGTVEAGLSTGREMAYQLIASFKKM